LDRARDHSRHGAGRGGRTRPHLPAGGSRRFTERVRSDLRARRRYERSALQPRPRIDRDVLQKHSEGVIVTSACMAGEVARHLTAGRREQAKEAAAWYADVFRDRYYLEVQSHDSEGQHQLNRQVISLADEMGLPLVATNDAHFLRAEDHDAHDVLLCIGLGKDRSDENRMKYDRGLYFKTASEIAARFPDRPEVIENTLAIADSVNVQFRQQYHVPQFPLPEDVSDEPSLLRRMVYDKAPERLGELTPALRERLDYELGVITNPK